MKTWEYSRALVILSSQKRLNIVCGRQFQTSVKQSVKHSIEEQIIHLGLEDEFDIQKEVIVQKVTGSVFEFQGLDRNIMNVKGWDHVDILWIEEAQTMLSDKLEIVLPSIRKAGSEVWFSFNRGKRSDAVDKMFLAKDSDLTEATVVQVSWQDNPNHPAELEIERQRCLKMHPERYPHIWDGEPDDTGGKWKVLSYAKLLKCVDAHIKLNYKPSGMVYSGLDIADEGNDTNCWSKRQGSLLSVAREWKVKYLHMTATKADFLNQESNVISMHYDAGGMGAGIKSDLSRIKHNPNSGLGAQAKRFIPFHFGGKVKGSNKYFIKHKQLKIRNKDYFSKANSQLWWNIKLRVENTIKALDGEKVDLDKCFFIDSSIDNLDKILSELSQCVYDDSSGKIVVDKAPDGADSPNVADSIILAYANDIKKGLKAA
ncbi:MAG: phage terminase large subunit [Candidatus Sabulitectum sp.]|nr:phage terminase large subunit [Candidatus Sabulitectum sp.]